MGYYTRFEVEVYPGDECIVSIEDTTAPFGTGCDTFEEVVEGHATDVKWYECQSDMEEFSKLFPTATFVITGYGEDALDIWRMHVRNGVSERYKAKMVFPEFIEVPLP